MKKIYKFNKLVAEQTSSAFDIKLAEVIKEVQENCLYVEVQYSVADYVYSALILGYQETE